jgi:hypothetical protein
VSLYGANADRRRLLGDSPLEGRSWYGQTEEAFTDDLGRFRFPDLSSGSYEITVRAEGRDAAKQAVTLREVDVLDVRVVFSASRVVVVTVVDATGAPVAGAYLNAYGGSQRGASGQTNAKGEARLVLTPGEWSVEVNVVSELDPQGRHFLPAKARVPPEAHDLRVVVEAAETITGTVRDRDEKPVANARLSFEAAGSEPWWGSVDSAGRFSVGVPRGSRGTVVAAGPANPRGGAAPPFRGEAKDVAAGARDVAIVVSPIPSDRTLVVRVLAPDGSAAAGATVHLSGVDANRSAVTDARGRAEFTGLLAVRVTPFVLPDAAHGAEWRAPRVDPVDPAGQEIEVRFALGVAVSGVVLAPDGRAVTRAMVDAIRPGEPYPFAAGMTDTSGRFRLLFDAAERFPVTLRATDPSASVRTEATLTVDRASTDLTIRLATPGK